MKFDFDMDKRKISKEQKKRKRWIRTGLLLIILVWIFLSFCLFADRFSFNNMLAYAQTLQYL